MPLLHLKQRLDVQLNASVDHPHGRVVSFSPDAVNRGFFDVDDKELLAHSIVKRLLPQSDAAAKRLVAERDAAAARDEAIARANSDYAAAMHDIQTAADEEARAAAAEWEKRREAAIANGELFTEPHPDSALASDMARTAPAGAAPVATAVLRMENVPPEAQASRVVSNDETGDAKDETKDAGKGKK